MILRSRLPQVMKLRSRMGLHDIGTWLHELLTCCEMCLYQYSRNYMNTKIHAMHVVPLVVCYSPVLLCGHILETFQKGGYLETGLILLSCEIRLLRSERAVESCVTTSFVAFCLVGRIPV